MIESIVGIILSIGDLNKKSRVFTSRGILYFSMWSFRHKTSYSFRNCIAGDLVEVVLNEEGALIGVREI